MVEWHGLARMKKLISDQFLNLNGWHFDPVWSGDPKSDQ
jgi:hypothetical protein